MKIASIRHSIVRASFAASALLLVATASPSAQQPQSGDQTLERAEPAQLPQAPRTPQAPGRPVETPYWGLSSGFEADSHETGYGFLGPTWHKPLRSNMQLVVGANVNYLYYEFDNGAGGRTNVRSPGVSTKAGVRIGDRNWVQFTGGPSFKRKQREIRNAGDQIVSSESDFEPGFSLGADVWANPTRRNNFHGMLHYGTEDGYLWSRAGFKQQISNIDWRNAFTHYLGAEYIAQGNEDIRSNQFGGFVEFLHAPSTISVMLRAGYKHSSFELGPDKKGPWFAVSFYRSYGRQ